MIARAVLVELGYCVGLPSFSGLRQVMAATIRELVPEPCHVLLCSVQYFEIDFTISQKLLLKSTKLKIVPKMRDQGLGENFKPGSFQASTLSSF